jgi:predicted transposase/invertase (TIGR01784 family)
MDQKQNKPQQEGQALAHQPHDKLFKAVFKTPAHAIEVLQACAPPALLASLKLDSLRVTDTSFIDEKLAGSTADIVYECQTATASWAYVSFIIDHKSTVPAYPPYKVMYYQNQAWGQQLREPGRKPAPVIPVLFYHGEERWKVRPWKTYLDGWDEAFTPYTPNGGYLFIDLSEMPDGQIRSLRSAFLKTALLLMKHRLERHYLLTNLDQVVNFVESEPSLDGEAKIAILQLVLRYVQSLKIIDWEEAKRLLKPLTLTNQVMSVLEEVKLEAYQEGIEQGIEKGIEKGIGQEARANIRSLIIHLPAASDEEIASLLSKPIELVAQVRREMEGEQEGE